MNRKIEIPLSKLKIGLLFLGAIGLFLLGSLFFISPGIWISSRFGSPEFIKIVGLSAMIFFGICGIFIGRKFFDDRIGLMIDEEGITDNSSATSVGLIEWEDITGIERLEIASSKILMIKTNQPDKYIERARNALSRRAMKANHKLYGSPITIISSSLQMKFSELEGLIESEWRKRKV